jgi:hypothetical protein
VKPIITSVFVIAGFALLLCGSAQAVEEFRCLGSGIFKGRVLDRTTIRTPRSISTAVGGAVCHGFIEPGSMITVQFESPLAKMSAGERVKLKGSLYWVSDPHRHLEGWLLKQAKLVQ